MSDQAQGLRNMLTDRQDTTEQETTERTTRIVTVTSGKGGVGKSNFTLNFALALQSHGYKVMIFDADIGLANIDVLMGITPKYNLFHLVKRQKTIWEIIYKGYNDVQFISGGSGFSDLLRLSEEDLEHFSEQINELNGYVDYILFDTGAGLSKETLKFIVSAHETIVVTTPEPTAITDAYAIIKMVHGMNYKVPFNLVVNRVSELNEGKRTAEKISLVAKQFLKLEIPMLGYIDEDPCVQKAVRKQIPFSVAFPNCSAAKSISNMALAFATGKKPVDEEHSGVRGFLNRMLKLAR
ncbi:MAG: MinD/ParA family protein [Paenibacillaceae bacterium]